VYRLHAKQSEIEEALRSVLYDNGVQGQKARMLKNILDDDLIKEFNITENYDLKNERRD
jgi:hypothetical protein